MDEVFISLLDFTFNCFFYPCRLGLRLLLQEQQFADLGDFRLESGAVIRECRVGYRTFGKLADDKSNVIVFPTWASGTTEQAKSDIGPGKLFDSDKFFVVAIDALGNGVSSSPSNSKAQPRMSFYQALPERHGKLTTCAAREGPAPEPCKGCDG